MMKRIALFAVLMTLVSYAGFGAKRTSAGVSTFANSQISDMALIYQGGAHRIDWKADEIEPYVTHRFADGTEEWLFDGFLFLEFKDGRGRQYSPGYDKQNARRVEWEWYLDRLFEQGKSLHALDSVIGEKKKTLGDPGFRHKIVITVPVAIKGQKDWGKLKGRTLDFDLTKDRIAATRWYIDKLTSRFKAEKFANLELVGLYWIDEDAVHGGDLLGTIAKYVHKKKLDFVWIPYYKARGHERWADLGFDIAYYQPNHFFHRDVADSRLDDAIAEALRCGMAMEFECDERALSSQAEPWGDRMDAYIDAFDRHGVWQKLPVAYYTGNHLLLGMKRDPSASNQRLADRLARRIVDRHRNARH